MHLPCSWSRVQGACRPAVTATFVRHPATALASHALLTSGSGVRPFYVDAGMHAHARCSTSRK